MPMPVSWVMRLPRGLREQPGWVFIGIMIALAGFSYATGFASSAIQLSIGGLGLQLWGSFLMFTGTLVSYSAWVGKPVLEKMALRWLAFALLAYCSWLALQVPLSLGVMAYTMSFILTVLAEIRVGCLKMILAGIDKDKKPPTQEECQ